MVNTKGQAHAANAPLTILLCLSVAILEGFDIQAMGVVAPKLAAALQLGPSQLGWVFSSANIGLILGAAIGGWRADRIGRKPVLIASVLLFGVFTLATTVAQHFDVLMAARFCTGLGFGGALPIIMALAADVSPPSRRASTAAMIFVGLPLGGGLSALATQGLAPDFDWRLLFYIGGALPLVIAPALLVFMQETHARTARTGPSPSAWTALFGGGRAPATLLMWLAFFPTLLMLYLILNWLPTLVVAAGLERAVAPHAALAFNFASIAGALMFGALVDRAGARWPLAAAYAGLIVALVSLAHAEGYLLILALSGLTGFFLLGANYALNGVAASYYPKPMRGVGAGASVVIGRSGAVIGPLIAGTLLSNGAGGGEIIGAMVPIAIIAGAAVFCLSLFKPAAS